MSIWQNYQDIDMLRPMGADPNSIFVSGFGSGGTMASSLNVIYSSSIKGSGIISGANYPKFLDHYQPLEDSTQTT